MRRLLALYLSTLAWMPAAAATLFIKVKLIGGGARLEESQVFLMVREAGRSDAGGIPALGRFIDQLSFFRADLNGGLWIVPAFLMAGALLVPLKLRPWFSALISSIVIAILYFQRQVAFGAGGFVSWRTLRDGAAWGIAHPGDIGQYLHADGLVRVSALLALVAGLACISPLLANRSGTRSVQRATAAVLVVFTALTAAAWLPLSTTIWAHTGVYERIAVALFEIAPPPPAVPSRDPVALARAYRALANAPDAAAPTEFEGKARGYNLILVILETTPSRILDLSGPLNRMPNLRRLREQAWVGLRHHTTHPRSDRSLFSILTSFYSADLDRVFQTPRPFPAGFLNSLKQQGYRTGLYLPNGDVLDFEASMWRGLGIDTLVKPAPRANEPGFWFTGWKVRDRLDREALRRMLTDIRESEASKTPFATLFYPQLGHAPWQDIREDGRELSVPQRGEEIVVHEDRLFGEIIATLEETGSINRTLIVVTGDHGIRIRAEDPAIPVGKVDAYSFQVPFLLYAPGIVETTKPLDWITSHIDISPTIGALFGLGAAPAAAEGSPVWDERIKDRATFFWSLAYHGAAGFHRGGRFAMWNTFYDRVYLSSALSFDAADAVENDSDDYASTKQTIREMDEINRRWVEALAAEGDERPATQ